MASGDLFNRKKLLARTARRARALERAGPGESQSAEDREVFERPTVLPATTAEEHAARAMRRLETTDEPVPPRRQPSQRPTRPSPQLGASSQFGASSQLSAGHTAPKTQRSAQLPPRQILGVLRAPQTTPLGAVTAPRGEGTRAAERVEGAEARAAERVEGVEARAAERVEGAEARAAARVDGVEARAAERVDGAEARAAARLDGAEARAAARLDGAEARAAARLDGAEARAAARLEGVEARAGSLGGSASGPSQSNPHSSLTLPSVESRGSVAGALRFVDAQSRRSLPPPTLDVARDALPNERRAAEARASLSELYALDDFSGALAVAEQRLAEDPDDAYAQRVASDCRSVLSQMYLARIGRWTQRPRVAVDDEQLRWLSLDHHGGFLLSQIDGTLTVEELLDVCGMPRVEALRILAELTEKGVVAIE